MKNIFASFLVLACMNSFAFTSGAQFKIAIEGKYPPFNSVNDKGDLQGFDYEVGQSLCAELKAKCEFVIQAFDGMIPGLQAKKYDLILSSMSITPKREEQVAFAGPYYRAGAIFVGAKGKSFDLTAAGLKGKRVGVARGTTYADYLKEKMPEAEIVYYDSADMHWSDLKAKRIELVLAQRVVSFEKLKQDDFAKSFEFKGEPILDEKLLGRGAGIAFRKEDKALLESFNKALAALRKSGRYGEINKKYFPFSIAPF